MKFSTDLLGLDLYNRPTEDVRAQGGGQSTPRYYFQIRRFVIYTYLPTDGDTEATLHKS